MPPRAKSTCLYAFFFLSPPSFPPLFFSSVYEKEHTHTHTHAQTEKKKEHRTTWRREENSNVYCATQLQYIAGLGRGQSVSWLPAVLHESCVSPIHHIFFFLFCFSSLLLSPVHFFFFNACSRVDGLFKKKKTVFSVSDTNKWPENIQQVPCFR